MSNKMLFAFLLIVITGVFLVNCTNNNGSKTDDTADRITLQKIKNSKHKIFIV